MGCKACQQKRQKALERRRELMEQKQSRLAEQCDQGDQSACRALHNLQATQAYREQHRYQHEHHRRAA